MKKLIIKSGKGNIVLKKSRKLVGLKSKSKNNLIEKSYVKTAEYNNLGGFNIVTLEGRASVDTKLDNARRKRDIEVGTHVYHVEGSNRPLVPSGYIYIVFEEGTNKEEQLLALDEFHLSLEERRDKNTILAKVTPKSLNPLKVAHLIQKASMVKYAEPDLDSYVDEYAFIEPEDNLMDHQWHFRNNGFVIDSGRPLKKGADARIIDAWKRLGNTGSKNIVIAIIDNGIDVHHPDLKDKIFKPFDLWSNSSTLEAGDPSYTHGTPCASVALAASNGLGMVGAAPRARFMPVSGTSFSLRATERMFNYCIQNGADIISCSWGTTDPMFNLSPLKEEAIAKAARLGRNGKGCVIIYAVGNEDQDFVNFYSAHPDVIAVAASTSLDVHANYSNRGREVTICAPSNGDFPIIAARASWDQGVPWETGVFKYWRDGISRGNRYKHFGGTSASTPLVAGICALVLSANPKLTAKQVKQILMRTADKIGSPSEYVNGHSKKYGAGRINADKAVAEAIRMKDSSTGTTIQVEENVAAGRGLFKFSVKRQASKGYGVQIGAFAEYGNVLIQAEKLEKKFGESIIVNINELNGKTVYKIIVGVKSTRNQAKLLHRKMKEAGVDGFIRNLKDLK